MSLGGSWTAPAVSLAHAILVLIGYLAILGSDAAHTASSSGCASEDQESVSAAGCGSIPRAVGRSHLCGEPTLSSGMLTVTARQDLRSLRGFVTLASRSAR